MWKWGECRVYSDELYHHGIIGQKWGVRRYQNPDGTLTAEGKARYTKQEIKDDFNRKIESEPERVKSIKRQGEKIVKLANSLGKKYKQAFSKAKEDFSEEDEKVIWDKLHKEFGNGSDDNELFEMVATDYVTNHVKEKVDKQLKTDIEDFKKAQDDYWREIDAFTSEFFKKYENAKVVEPGLWGWKETNEKIDKLIINNELGFNLGTSTPSYIFRHFDDYWVYENGLYKAGDNIVNSYFTQEKYNEKYRS